MDLDTSRGLADSPVQVDQYVGTTQAVAVHVVVVLVDIPLVLVAVATTF